MRLNVGLPLQRPQVTREDVLAAARDIFEDRGYAEATIHLIAERAGASIGQVRAEFSDKAALLGQVLTQAFDALNDEFNHAARCVGGATVDRLRAILNAHHDVEARRARLFLAIVGGRKARSAAEPLTPPTDDTLLRDQLIGTLRSGLERGEVRADADLDAFIDLLLAVYAWNYRLAAKTTAEGQRLILAMDQQTALLFDSVAAAV